MRQDIRDHLMTLSESEYKEFSAALIPGVNNMLGIRLPELRKLAKQIAKSDWKEAVCEEDIYFEEKMLRGMILNYVKGEYGEILPYITAFIPLVDNWSVCDSVFMGMAILQKDRERTWGYIQPYFYSGKEFEVRVALIIMMQHLLKCDAEGKKISRLRTVDMQAVNNDTEEPGMFINRILGAINREFTEGYYASMAAAWLLAECFCVYPYHTMEFMKENALDKVTFHKGIRKILESRIPTDEVKQILRCMKG
ncbi:MAG: DNA alkylation repair protein [Clostridium sp.]|nr:DNA alkylation repair protein [Clostridium sp.]